MINYNNLLMNYPWIVKRNQNYILSPDSDGFLCGLLMTNYLDSNVAGWYDGKVLLIKEGISVRDCIFLDVDINRQNIKSVGHHMVCYNKRLNVANFNYGNCIQPNVLRNFDGKNDFQRKYPDATIHLLLGILQAAGIIDSIPERAEWPLLFSDGVWNNLFGYTENCIDWIEYLGINDSRHILNTIFCSSNKSFYDIMIGLNEFLRIRDHFNAVGYFDGNTFLAGGRNKRTGHQLRITNSRGALINLVGTPGNRYNIHQNEKNRIKGFISAMSEYIEFDYLDNKWAWTDLKLYQFTKSDFSNSNLNNGTYSALMSRNPFSMAMTSGANIEYTLEEPDNIC